MMMFKLFILFFFFNCFFVSVLQLSSFHMANIRIGTLNLNGARDDVKRASLFKLIEFKHIDVMLIQETHSTEDNKIAWEKEWNAEIILSHNTSNSGGVGILFSRHFMPQSCEFEEIVKGRLLKVRVCYENVMMVFIVVYAPTVGLERVCFLNKLADVMKDCDIEEHLFLGGDFNCTVNDRLDRNHQEPHPASRRRLSSLVETYELCDVWRRLHQKQKQYTWVHTRDNFLSLARLDRFYCFKHHFSVFSNCCISPVGFSDHSLVHCSVFIKCVKPQSAYWHFNTALLSDKAFLGAFKYFLEYSWAC